MIAFIPRFSSSNSTNRLSSVVSDSPRLNTSYIDAVVIDRRTDTLNDVVDVCVIAPRRSVAEYLDRFSLGDQPREFMDREIGSLPCSVNGKESETDSSNIEKMRVGVAEKLARRFRRGVWRDRLMDPVIFGKRNLGIDAVNRTR